MKRGATSVNDCEKPEFTTKKKGERGVRGKSQTWRLKISLSRGAVGGQVKRLQIERDAIDQRNRDGGELKSPREKRRKGICR